MATPFVSITDLNALLGKDVTGDALVPIALDSACETVRQYIGQKVNYVANDIVTFDGRGREALLLPELPVVLINSVAEDGQTLNTTDYYTLGDGGILYRKWRWSWGRDVVVNYDHGYAVTEPVPVGQQRVPSDLRRVALNIAARMYQEKGRTLGLRGETIGDYSYTLAADMPSIILPDEKEILDRHRVRKVPVA